MPRIMLFVLAAVATAAHGQGLITTQKVSAALAKIKDRMK